MTKFFTLVIASAFIMSATAAYAGGTAGDAKKGRAIFNTKCKMCHSAAEGAKHKMGPNLWGVAGRPIGTAKGYKYSSAVKAFGGNWTDENLDKFITKPKKFIAKTKMGFTGLRKEELRTNLIAHLHTLK